MAFAIMFGLFVYVLYEHKQDAMSDIIEIINNPGVHVAGLTVLVAGLSLFLWFGVFRKSSWYQLLLAYIKAEKEKVCSIIRFKE
jgi:hypothetical protein